MTRCLFIQIHATPKPAEPNVTQARKCHCGIHQKTPGPNPSSNRMLLGKMLFSCLFFLARTQNPDLVFARATVRKEMKKKQLPVGCARFFSLSSNHQQVHAGQKEKGKTRVFWNFPEMEKKKEKGNRLPIVAQPDSLDLRITAGGACSASSACLTVMDVESSSKSAFELVVHSCGATTVFSLRASAVSFSRAASTSTIVSAESERGIFLVFSAVYSSYVFPTFLAARRMWRTRQSQMACEAKIPVSRTMLQRR